MNGNRESRKGSIMAGTVRIMMGMFFVLIGLFSLIFIVGIFPLLIGFALIAWGMDAKRREAAYAIHNQMMVQQTQMLQQMAMSQFAQSTQSPYLSEPAERYCQICGAGNTWASSYCQKCGKPLPPPNIYYSVNGLPSLGQETGD